MEIKGFDSRIGSIDEIQVMTILGVTIASLLISTLCVLAVSPLFQHDLMVRITAFISIFLFCVLTCWLCIRSTDLFFIFAVKLINWFRARLGRPSIAYDLRCDEDAKARNEEKERRKTIIAEYIQYEMPPFLPENEIVTLKNEILNWMDNASYRPSGLEWHWKFGVHNIDMRHFIWNIGVRLNSKEGHTLTCAAEFVSQLFEKLFHNVEFNTIRNLKAAEQNLNYILLDNPSEGSIEFHYKKSVV